MKVQKCNHCGYSSVIHIEDLAYDYCPRCYPTLIKMDIIEIIDWEYELIINNKNNTEKENNLSLF